MENQGAILIIDDESLVRRTLEKFLDRQGFKVLAASDVIGALNYVRSEDLSLIISDILMPEVNGIETLRQIREEFKRLNKPMVPEICLTGFASDDLISQVKELEVADLIYKPFDLADLLDCIQRHLKE